MTAPTPTYRMPTEVRFGEGQFDALARLPALRDARTVALLTGRRSIESGLRDRLALALEGRSVRLLPAVPPQPRPADLLAVVEPLAADGCDAIVAVGGGSVIDVGKGAAYCLRHGTQGILPALRIENHGSVVVIAVPTTSGTGSEVTPFATFWDVESKTKLSIEHETMFPDVAVCDPCLTYSMPGELTASTGMDAFTQACEAYFNLNHNPTSDAHALRAVELIFEALPRVLKRPDDRDARRAMMQGSLDAGLAFSNTRTTACHSLSYPMTSYFGVQHGRAVGVTLPEVLTLNADALEDCAGDARRDAERRRAAFCDRLGVPTARDAAERIRGLMRRCDLPTRLSQIGIDEAGVDLIVRLGTRSNRMNNNPFAFTETSLRDMLERIL